MSKALLQTVTDARTAIMLAAYGGDIYGWVCEKVFVEKTGLDSAKQRYDFRRNNPELVKAHGNKFIYVLPGYFNLFK